MPVIENETKNSFWKGVMSTFDLYPQINMHFDALDNAWNDMNLLKKDWENIGNDIKTSIEQFDHARKNTTKK